MKLSRFSKQIIAVACSIAMLAVGLAFVPANSTKADDYSDLTFKVSNNNQNLAVAFVTQGGVTTEQEVNYCLDQGNNFYCATTAAFTKPNFKTVTCNGNVEDPARGGANFWVPMSVLNDNAYNLVTIEDAGGNTAQFVIRKGTPVDPTESESVDPSAPTTTAAPTTTTEAPTMQPTVLPDFPNLDWTTVTGMYTDVAYSIIDRSMIGFDHMNFYGTNYMQFVGSGDSKLKDGFYEVKDQNGNDISNSIQPFDKADAILGIMISKLGTSNGYYLFTVDNPNTGRAQVAIRIGHPEIPTTTPDPSAPTTTTALPVPGAPVGLVANIINDGKTVYVAHGPASGTVSGYHYYLDGTLDSRFSNGCNISVSEFNPGQTYTIEVKAYNDSGEGPAATSSFTIPNPEPENYMDVTPYKSTTPATAPTKAGKIFAGWFEDAEFTTPYMETTGKAYAKFIDEDVLGTKFQTAMDGTAVRFLSSLDSMDYQSVGFKFTGTYGNTTITEKTKSVEKLYTSIKADGQTVLPSVFSDDSAYFFTYTVRGMDPQVDSTWDVTPFYVTLDGTTVEGTSGLYPPRD